MPDLLKQQSNPFSTGGGGPIFETRVQAAFTILLLTGRVAPCLPSWPITKVKLQGHHAGFHTDDFIVFTKDFQSQKEAKLLAQIKHGISITESNETLAEVIKAAWTDFNNAEVFNPEFDVIALITEYLSATDINNVRPLLEWARHSENDQEFLNKVNTAHFSSDEKRKKLKVFKRHLAAANEGKDVLDRRLWEFLKSFYLLGYDLDTESGITLSLLQSLISQYSTGNPVDTWSKIVNAVQSANQDAGTITLDTLPSDLCNLFDTSRSRPWDLDLKKLKEHGEFILDSIRMSIGGVHIKRPEFFSRLLDASEAHKFIFISGNRGCGKSSLVREFFDFVKDRFPVFCLRTESFNQPHLSNLFSSIGLTSSIGDIGTGFALMPNRFLLIESIEKLLELEKLAAFTDLLHFLNKHPGWTVIVTGREYAYQQIAINYLQPSGLNHFLLKLENFNEEEIQRLCEQLEPLKAIAENPLLKSLIQNPFLAELAYRVAAAGTQFSIKDGEKEFQIAVWRDVIAKEQERTNGLPLKRKQLFIKLAVRRAKQMVYGVPEHNFDPEALLKLEGDNLIQRDRVNCLVSPAHDVLEDWALEQHIEVAYRQNIQNVVKFLDTIGHEPAMNRAYRLWLHQKLKQGEKVKSLILDILNNQKIKRHWQDETLSAVLLGDNPYDFLKELGDQLFENDGEFLNRLCFILRLTCKEPDQELTKQATAFNDKVTTILFFKPYGQGWEAVIRFLLENKERISDSIMPHIATVVEEWTSIIHLDCDLPATAREAGLLALWLLKTIKDSYRNKDNHQKMINVIITTAPAIQNEFHELLDADVFRTSDKKRPHYIQDFCKTVLEGNITRYLCRYFPDSVIKLAFQEWRIDETKSDDDELWGSSRKEVEECFGLHPFRYEFSPASGAKGPFQYLLRLHPRKGLDFILQLMNQTAETYAHSDLDKPSRYKVFHSENKQTDPNQIEIQIADGQVIKQYCSARLWGGYRGFSVVPGLLQCALMALENWLIDCVEHSKSQETLEWIFDHILRNSNSVMTTAVLASIATGFPHKLGKTALPLLRTPDLFDLDLARAVREHGKNETNWFAPQLHWDPLARFCAEERATAALHPWRKEHLENLIQRLQFSDLREETLAAIDELRLKAPDTDSWRFRFHRIDTRRWKAVEDKENNQIIFKADGLESDLEEIQQKTQKEAALNNRFFQLSLWSTKVFNQEPLESESYTNLNEAVTEAKDLFQLLTEDTSREFKEVHLGGIVKSAAVFLRDYENEMTKEDQAWCAKAVIQAIESNADIEDSFPRESKVDLDGSIAAASVLPILLDFTEEEDQKCGVKRVIASALTHVNAGICTGISNGIREHLWQRDPDFAQKCLFGAIKFARFKFENSHRKRLVVKETLVGSSESAKPSVWIKDLCSQLVMGDLELDKNYVDKLGFNTHSSWHLLNPCLMIPNGSTDPFQVCFLSRILFLLFKAEEITKNHQSQQDSAFEISYELPLAFNKRLAEYLLNLSDSDSQRFVEQLQDGCAIAPSFISSLLNYIAFFAEKLHKKEAYWTLWGQLSKKVVTIANEPAKNGSPWKNQDDDRELVRSMLHADIPWQKVDYENQDIALGKELILEFVRNAGENPDVFESLASLMYHFPNIFCEPGIPILAKHLIEADGTQLLSGSNTAFYLESSIRQFLQVIETGPLSRNMHQACLVLLNAVVEMASSRAYFLREHLIRSRRVL